MSVHKPYACGMRTRYCAQRCPAPTNNSPGPLLFSPPAAHTASATSNSSTGPSRRTMLPMVMLTTHHTERQIICSGKHMQAWLPAAQAHSPSCQTHSTHKQPLAAPPAAVRDGAHALAGCLHTRHAQQHGIQCPARGAVFMPSKTPCHSTHRQHSTMVKYGN